MQNDPVADFRAPGEAFTLRNPYPDNGWMCSAPSLSLNHVGLDVNAMFDATRADMTDNGWSEEGMVPAEDFAVYYKTIDGEKIEANVWKRAFWVEVDLNGPESAHFGEMGFGS